MRLHHSCRQDVEGRSLSGHFGRLPLGLLGPLPLQLGALHVHQFALGAILRWAVGDGREGRLGSLGGHLVGCLVARLGCEEGRLELAECGRFRLLLLGRIVHGGAADRCFGCHGSCRFVSGCRNSSFARIMRVSCVVLEATQYEWWCNERKR